MRNFILNISISVFLTGVCYLPITKALFTDTETIMNNSVTAGVWVTPEPSPSPTPSVSPTSSPTPTPTVVNPGDIVINEVMWMGSTVSTADEWIELRNTTGHVIDISNWRIGGAVAGIAGHLEIPHGYSIPAGGYFLIANKYEDDVKTALNVHLDLRDTALSLHNTYSSNGPLILKDKDLNIIDQTPPALLNNWPAGVNGTDKKSMERNDDPSTGWHTCIEVGCLSGDFWDLPNDKNYGTPGGPNLSDEENVVTDFYRMDGNRVGFKIKGLPINKYSSFDYVITYKLNSLTHGIPGTRDLYDEFEYAIEGIYLGSCSDEVCSPHLSVTDLKLKVDLEGTSAKTLQVDIN